MDIDPDVNHILVENPLPMGVRAVQIGIVELCIYFKKDIKLRGEIYSSWRSYGEEWWVYRIKIHCMHV